MPKSQEDIEEIKKILNELPHEIKKIINALSLVYLKTKLYESPLGYEESTESKSLLGIINLRNGNFLFIGNYKLSSGAILQIKYLNGKENTSISVKLPYYPTSKISRCIYLEEDEYYPFPHFECFRKLNKTTNIYELPELVREVLLVDFGIRV